MKWPKKIMNFFNFIKAMRTGKTPRWVKQLYGVNSLLLIPYHITLIFGCRHHATSIFYSSLVKALSILFAHHFMDSRRGWLDRVTAILPDGCRFKSPVRLFRSHFWRQAPYFGTVRALLKVGFLEWGSGWGVEENPTFSKMRWADFSKFCQQGLAQVSLGLVIFLALHSGAI